MKTTARKGLTVGFVATAALLAMASVAYACTTYRGTMTVTITSGDDGHGHTETAAIGANGDKGVSMGYCTTVPSGWGSTNNPKGAAHMGTAGGGITVTVAPADVCKGKLSGTNKLADGTNNYEVNFNPGKMFTSTSHIEPYVRAGDCMIGEPGNIRLDADFDVANGGHGSASYTIGTQTANATGEDGGVCVSRDGNPEGMQVPLTVV